MMQFGVRISEISNAKFSSPALPGETLNFSAQAQSTGGLRFRIDCGQRNIASGSLRIMTSGAQ